MKKLKVPTDFTEELLLSYARLNDTYKSNGAVIDEIFGSHYNGVLGSGRPSNTIPSPSDEQLKEHIACAHSLGIRFDYLLNAFCIGDIDMEPGFLNRLGKLLDFLADAGVDIITVANPFVLEFINQHYDFELATSLYTWARTSEQMEDLERMGANSITICQDIQRDISLIRELRAASRLELIVIVNPICKLNCPWRFYHGAVNAHVIDPGTPWTAPMFYFWQLCFQQRFSDLAEVIKTPWIRPEDIDTYAALGIDVFKIQGRRFKSETLVQLAETYLSGSFEGDLFQLIFAPEEMVDVGLSLPNRSLDGFLDFFVRNEPRCSAGCGNCNYCSQVAAQALVPLEGGSILQRSLEACSQALSKLVSL